MAGFSTGGGGLSGGSSGPAESAARSSSAFDNAFNVSFGASGVEKYAPWLAIAVVGIAALWIIGRKR